MRHLGVRRPGAALLSITDDQRSKRRQAAALQGGATSEVEMKFAKVVFLVAGIYGLLVLVPQFFLEARIGRDTPPPITHPEFFYGFICVAVAWQVLFLVLSKDPVRYRPM